MSKDLTEALREATGQTYYQAYTSWRPNSLPQAPTPAPIPPRTGAARSALPAAEGEFAFVESDYALREHYTQRVVRSSDGIWSFAIKPIKKIHLEGNATMEFKEPPA